MIYNSVADIYEQINETRNLTHQRVEGLNEEQTCFRAEPDSWCVAELVEHICLSEESLMKRLVKLLAEAEAQARVGGQIAPFSLDELRKLADGNKFSAPDFLRPRREQSVEDILARMRTNRESLIALRPRFEGVDASGVTFPHPVFGPLNPYQWLAFCGVHEARHLAQIEATIASPSFPGRAKQRANDGAV